jgi:Cu/Ag efflux protein CusF
MTAMTAIRRPLWTLVLSAIATCTHAQEPAAPVVNSRFEKVEATVEAVDLATREVSLRGAKGSVSVIAGPEVRNLDKVHVGDKVVVSYYQGIAAQMAKGDSKVTEPAVAAFAYRAEKGAQPGAGVGASMTGTVVVERVDTEANTVTVKDRNGKVHVIAVKSPNMQQFIRTLKQGDSVDVTYTESVAINVVPAKG